MVFAAGAFLNKFWLMDAGRFIFGMGGENLQVAQNAYAVGWFKGKELNMVFGLQLSMARIGRLSKTDMNAVRKHCLVCLCVCLYVCQSGWQLSVARIGRL